MQYKADFFIGIFLAMTFSSLGPVFQYLIFSQTRGYPRWNLPQIILFQGVMLVWLGLKDLLFGDIRLTVEAMVKGGNFDRLLLKPYSAIGVILAGGFYFQGAGTIIAGGTIVVVAALRLGLTLSWWQPLALAAFLAAGLLLHMAITVLYCITVIMITHMGRLGEILDKLLAFSQFPIDILNPVFRMIITVGIPIAVWIYFPTETLLNRVEPIAMVSVASAGILLWASLLLWKVALKKYTSAGG